MTLITDTGDAERLLKYLADAIPQGPHPDPHAEWVSVRLDVVQTSIDHIEWLEKGNEEWRQMALQNRKHAEAARATARVAIGHLDKVLNKCRSHDDQQAADTAARDWLASIGHEPT
jgi:hypothetical protein